MTARRVKVTWAVLAICAVGLAAAYVIHHPLSAAAPTGTAETPGSSLRPCALCPEMIVVPSGTFVMGTPPGAGSDDERPAHPVTIAKPFALARTETTFAQWDACVADGGCTLVPDDNGWGRGDRPVINISYDDTRQYLAWLSRTTGTRYRLPSEAEWEYAARAGSNSAAGWATAASQGSANCRDCGSPFDYERTAPVGSFAPNAFGLYDMFGNVLEWCEDGWHEAYDGAPADGSVFTGGDPRLRVMRGGSWVTLAALLRSAYRDKSSSFDRNYVTGFRVAADLPLAPR